jgi:hypothetical protein
LYFVICPDLCGRTFFMGGHDEGDCSNTHTGSWPAVVAALPSSATILDDGALAM